MCLIKKSLIPRIALKDIIVYKKLDKADDKLYTKVTGNAIEIGNIYEGIFKKSIRLSGYPSTLVGSLFSRYIASGYIHSCISISATHSWGSGVIVKCIIPRGTLYFIGDNMDIASRKLKYVKII